MKFTNDWIVWWKLLKRWNVHERSRFTYRNFGPYSYARFLQLYRPKMFLQFTIPMMLKPIDRDNSFRSFRGVSQMKRSRGREDAVDMYPSHVMLLSGWRTRKQTLIIFISLYTFLNTLTLKCLLLNYYFVTRSIESITIPCKRAK